MARTRLLRRVVGPLAAAVVALSVAPPVGAAPDQQVFTSTGAAQTFTTPAGVHRLRITAIGGSGGRGASSTNAAGGAGRTVSGELPVMPGQKLYVLVGGNGGDGPLGTGGFNGGGNGGSSFYYYGGGGGGASDVRTIAPGTAGTLGSRLVVAAGGGGSGGASSLAAGAGDQPGAGSGGVGGGGAGTKSTGGTAGASAVSVLTPSTPGVLGVGGAGASPNVMAAGGGGGGGGLFGGGGGGSSTSAAGGGGGSSFVDPSLSAPKFAATAAGTAPSITIGFDIAPTLDLDPAAIAFPGQALGTASEPSTLTLRNSGAAPLVVSGLSLSGDAKADFTVESSCSSPVAVGGSCTVKVRFLPLVAGARTATLDLASNAPGGPAKVSLSGFGSVASAPLGDGSGAPPGAGPPGLIPPAPTPVPTLSALRLTPATFRAKRPGAKKKTGTRIIATTAAAATVTFTVVSLRTGITSGTRCVAPPKKKSRGAKRCTRERAAGTITAALAAGETSVAFDGRLKGRALPAGNYRLDAVLTAGGATGPVASAKFRVKR